MLRWLLQDDAAVDVCTAGRVEWADSGFAPGWLFDSGLSDAAWVMGSTMTLGAVCPTAMGIGADVLFFLFQQSIEWSPACFL